MDFILDILIPVVLHILSNYLPYQNAYSLHVCWFLLFVSCSLFLFVLKLFLTFSVVCVDRHVEGGKT